MSTAHWPWWLGALALASVAVGYTTFVGRPLGVSGLVQRAVTSRGERGTSALFLVGLVGGGLLAALTHGGLALQGLDAVYAGLFSAGPGAIAALAVGGLLVGFGTSLAGGCTSGHGLVGCARLQPGSLVATAAFFGTAVGVSLLLARVLA